MKNVIVIFGGESPEHDISIITGVMALNAIDRNLYTPIPIFVDKKGEWFTSTELFDLSFYKKIDYKKLIKVALLPPSDNLFSIKNSKIKSFAKIYSAVNCMHGGEGEKGGVGAIFKQCKIPCASSGLFPSSLAMDKEFTKIALQGIGVDFLPYVRIKRETFYLRREYALKFIGKKLGYPVIVKPANLGSSIGIEVATDEGQIERGLERAFLFDEKVVVEKFLQGAKEINCAVYKKGGERVVSECEEPTTSKEFLTFEDKYQTPSVKKFPAEIPEQLSSKIKEITSTVYKKFGFSGVVRMDYLIRENQIFLNEINSIPGSLSYYLFCKTPSDFSQMLTDLIEESVDEYREYSRSVFTFKSDVLNLDSCKIKK